MKNRIARVSVAILLILSTLLVAVGCNTAELDSLSIINEDNIELEIGYTVQLKTDAPNEIEKELEWAASSSCVTVDGGYVVAKSLGKATVMVSYGSLVDSVVVEVVEDLDVLPGDNNGVSPSEPGGTEYPTVDEAARDAFYGDADPADSYAEAIERSSRGELSGATEVPDQAPVLSAYRPMSGDKLIRNENAYFADSNTYVVVNAYGNEVFRVYRGGGYITLEEVAAYVYAFGDVPANYDPNKNASPRNSVWGEHLRANHSRFSGSTSKYPYEPELPNISGCGGTYQYMEIDIGTTGTDCDPSYIPKLYNNGTYISRGAARIVYAQYDKNGNRQLEPDERYVFYTYNHYNDFQEYLNYYGGWGEMFGNITGGGTISSRYDYNPTPYVEVVKGSLRSNDTRVTVVMFCEPRRYDEPIYVAA